MDFNSKLYNRKTKDYQIDISKNYPLLNKSISLPLFKSNLNKIISNYQLSNNKNKLIISPELLRFQIFENKIKKVNSKNKNNKSFILKQLEKINNSIFPPIINHRKIIIQPIQHYLIYSPYFIYRNKIYSFNQNNLHMNNFNKENYYKIYRRNEVKTEILKLKEKNKLIK